MSGGRWLPATLWAAGLLGLGSIPDLGGPEVGLPLDKIAHLLLYGVLGLLAGGAWVRARRPHPGLVVAAALLVGVVDEVNQSRVAGRSAEVADWIMDAVGIVSGFALRWRAARSRTREQRQ